MDIRGPNVGDCGGFFFLVVPEIVECVLYFLVLRGIFFWAVEYGFELGFSTNLSVLAERVFREVQAANGLHVVLHFPVFDVRHHNMVPTPFLSNQRQQLPELVTSKRFEGARRFFIASSVGRQARP